MVCSMPGLSEHFLIWSTEATRKADAHSFILWSLNLSHQQATILALARDWLLFLSLSFWHGWRKRDFLPSPSGSRDGIFCPYTKGKGTFAECWHSPPGRQSGVCSSWAPSSLETLSLVTSLSEAVPCWRVSCQPPWISTAQSKLELRSSPELLWLPPRKEMLSAQLKSPPEGLGLALPTPKPSLLTRAEGY